MLSRQEAVDKIVNYISNLELDEQSFIYDMCSPYRDGKADYDDYGDWPGIDPDEMLIIANLILDGETNAFFDYNLDVTNDILAIVESYKEVA